MSTVGRDDHLLQAVFGLDFDAMVAALEAGATLNGPPKAHCAPIVAATMVNHVGMVEYFLEQGADADRPVTVDLVSPISGLSDAAPGERALHIASGNGNGEIVRLLLKQGRADPNATDNDGCTPLMIACETFNDHECVVRRLLEAGANPSLAQKNGFYPLHYVALYGNLELVDMLYPRAPATLNGCAEGKTPLVLACDQGHESMVSKLLSLGAMQPVLSGEHDVACPFAVALGKGFDGVLRILINEGGIRAVGGMKSLSAAFYVAVRSRRATFLQLLLRVDAVEMRSALAMRDVKRLNLLHVSTLVCYPAAVSVLLSAGMDEAARDSMGHIPRDIIGLCLGEDIQFDWGQAVAIRRMLHRSPAYRARSWAWPFVQEAGGYECGGGGTSAAAPTLCVRSSPQAVKRLPCIGVRVVRWKETGGSKSFVRLVGRYCAKN